MLKVTKHPTLRSTAPMAGPLPDATPLSVEACGMTDRGREREKNEDQFLIGSLSRALRVEHSSVQQAETYFAENEAHLFVVADGMGGHQGGAHASALAVALVERYLLEAFPWTSSFEQAASYDIPRVLGAALRAANRSVCAKAAKHPELEGMGTTLTLACSFGSELFVAHAGDSRCYLARNETLSRLTEDHTVVERLVREGLLEREAAETHPLSHIVTNVVGSDEPKFWTEMNRMHLEPSDTVLLCSDGLTRMVPEARILSVLDSERTSREACSALIALANEAGGRDNCTAIVVRYEAITRFSGSA